MREYFYSLATDKRKGPFAAFLRIILLLLSFVYGVAVRILMFMYGLRPCRLPCRVISVGNITLGGTGKTSLVELITERLKADGRKVAIISRGYKRRARNSEVGFPGYGAMGDEPYMLSRNLPDVPVVVDQDRVRAVRRAVQEHSINTAVLDDGFQQWRIKKDLEIVTIDATNPFGNRHLLSRGILRQPLSSLKRADVFVLTKTDQAGSLKETKLFLNRVNPRAFVFESVHMPVGFYELNDPEKLLAVNALKGKTVTAIAGIGAPESFEALLNKLGVSVGLFFTFPDHHQFTRKDLESIITQSGKKHINKLVTTQKDSIRINPWILRDRTPQIFVLRIRLKIDDEEGFFGRLSRLYGF